MNYLNLLSAQPRYLVYLLCLFFLGIPQISTAGYTYKSLEGIVIRITDNGTTIKTEYGSLFRDQGFVKTGGYEVPSSVGASAFDPATLAAINGKYLVALSAWLSLDKINGGGALKYFPKSNTTYDISNTTYVIVTLVKPSNSKDTKPTFSQIATEWDAEAGQQLTIPISVTDNEQDDFVLKSNLRGSQFSALYTAGNGLPTMDFQWTPTAAQANKVFTVRLTALETSAKKLSSKAITFKIRVWPTGGQTDTAAVTKLTISKALWGNDLLTLSGKVELNKIMSNAQKSVFLAKQLPAIITQGKTGTGLQVGDNYSLSLQPNGSWTLSNINLPASVPFSCSVTLAYEGKFASKTIGRAPSNCLRN
jgi:hypothetical protein